MNEYEKPELRHLSVDDRKIIEQCLNRNDSIYSIGIRIGFSDKAIHKEIARNSTNGKYTAEEAQKIAEERRSLQLSKAIETMNRQNKIKERVDALEEFCRTLSTLIEELHDKINNRI